MGSDNPIRMLKKSASSVLASFSPQRGLDRLTNSAARTDLVPLIRRTVRSRGTTSALHSLRPCLPEWRVLAHQGWADEKSGIFEHPAAIFSCCATRAEI